MIQTLIRSLKRYARNLQKPVVCKNPIQTI